MSEVVLDASAVLAYLLGEPGEDVVAQVLESGLGVISTVNLSEVVAKLADVGMTRAEIEQVVDGLDLRVVAFTRAHALECARWRLMTRSLGLSLGDRACLALAGELSLPVLTTDRAWAELGGGSMVRVIRP